MSEGFIDNKKHTKISRTVAANTKKTPGSAAPAMLCFVWWDEKSRLQEEEEDEVVLERMSALLEVKEMFYMEGGGVMTQVEE